MARTWERVYLVMPYTFEYGIFDTYATTAFKSKEDALTSAKAVWEGFKEDNDNFETDDWEIIDENDWELDDDTKELDVEYSAISSFTAEEIHVIIKSISLVGRES